MPDNVNHTNLSPRELDVVRRIVAGKKYRDIAEELGLGYETIKTYAARIRSKLGVHSKTEIATWYLLEFCEDNK